MVGVSWDPNEKISEPKDVSEGYRDLPVLATLANPVIPGTLQLLA